MDEISRKNLLKEYENLLIGRWLTDLANTSAFLYSQLPNVNWVGFYLLNAGVLELGPFQGLPAYTDIPLGRGVCGKAAQLRETIVVEDVDQFPDHIVCDSKSRSEIVIPLIRNGEVLGVLDIDSPQTRRFTEADRDWLEHVVQTLLVRSR